MPIPPVIARALLAAFAALPAEAMGLSAASEAEPNQGPEAIEASARFEFRDFAQTFGLVTDGVRRYASPTSTIRPRFGRFLVCFCARWRASRGFVSPTISEPCCSADLFLRGTKNQQVKA